MTESNQEAAQRRTLLDHLSAAHEVYDGPDGTQWDDDLTVADMEQYHLRLHAHDVPETCMDCGREWDDTTVNEGTDGRFRCGSCHATWTADNNTPVYEVSLRVVFDGSTKELEAALDEALAHARTLEAEVGPENTLHVFAKADVVFTDTVEE